MHFSFPFLALSCLCFAVSFIQAAPFDGGIAAAAESASHIDRQRVQPAFSPVIVPQSIVRRQYYPAAPRPWPFQWFAHYFLPQNWRYWSWRRGGSRPVHQPVRRGYVTNNRAPQKPKPKKPHFQHTRQRPHGK